MPETPPASFYAVYKGKQTKQQHRSAVQTVAGVPVPGHCDPVPLAPAARLDGRSLECISLPVWLACEAVSKTYQLVSRLQVPGSPVGVGFEGSVQVERGVPFTCVSTLSGVGLDT